MRIHTTAGVCNRQGRSVLRLVHYQQQPAASDINPRPPARGRLRASRQRFSRRLNDCFVGMGLFESAQTSRSGSLGLSRQASLACRHPRPGGHYRLESRYPRNPARPLCGHWSMIMDSPCSYYHLGISATTILYPPKGNGAKFQQL